MTIYEELIERVSNGEPFKIDFEKKNIKIGKKFLVKDGLYDESRVLFGAKSLDIPDIMKLIESMYYKYKYSLPSERSDGKRKKYFKALPIEEIPDELLMSAERREVTQAKLEGYILCLAMDNNFKWDDISHGWFYQSVSDPDFVILRSWIENK